MTPKEKAEELFYKFNTFNSYSLDKMCCKKSAIYLCNEVIKAHPKDEDGFETSDYWEQVKEEINKI